MPKDTHELRFELHHQLVALYRDFFDRLADAELRDGDAARLAQRVLLSRQEALKHLVDPEELPAYAQLYPDDLEEEA
ncbi:hypothetical protein [Synechococcus elongatus]|uniref:DUF2164 domain-containing protein n=1 Tax=Synechococcus elongatus PCC 11802 TaxID=2283154 RepID=A0AAT9K3B5_SYNEL|nr:hypothetical protein [Synechococcus elongatus]QFZ91360.1 hypothetical protein EKO22_02225 [Synechococcus elongatus PCC 11802]